MWDVTVGVETWHNLEVTVEIPYDMWGERNNISCNTNDGRYETGDRCITYSEDQCVPPPIIDPDSTLLHQGDWTLP